MQKIIAAGEEAAGMLSEMGAVPLSEAEKKEWLSMYRLLDQQIDSLLAEEAPGPAAVDLPAHRHIIKPAAGADDPEPK